MAHKAFPRFVKILLGSQTGAEAEFTRLERFAHFWVLAGQSFVRNRCPVRAAALSYTSLLALIPLLAVAIGITSSLLKNEGEERIYDAIDKFVSDVMPPAAMNPTNAAPLSPQTATNPPAGLILTNAPTTATPTNAPAQTGLAAPTGSSDRVVTAQKEAARYIRTFIQQTRSGALGVAGTVLLIFVVFSLLGRIEETMNDVWGVTHSRNWLTRFEHYWFAIGLVPTLLIAGLILASGPRFAGVRHFIESMPLVGGLVFKFIPLLLLWLGFAAFYKIMPNTKVRFDAAFIGGIVGGSLWYLNNMFGSLYISRVVSNSKIYGGLGLVPVFMIGLYFSWLILLFGAQFAYAFQNRKAYLQEKLVENVNQRGREFIALRLMTCVGQRFHHGQPPVTIQEISAELGIPTRLVQQVLRPLLAARLVTEVAGAEAAYAPARPLDTINAHHVLHALRAGGGQEPLLRDEPVRAEVYGEFARIEEAERQAAAAVTMLALVSRAQARLAVAAPPPETDKTVPLPPEKGIGEGAPTAVASSSSFSSSSSKSGEEKSRTKDEDEVRKSPGENAAVSTAAPTPAPSPGLTERPNVVEPEDQEFPL